MAGRSARPTKGREESDMLEWINGAAEAGTEITMGVIGLRLALSALLGLLVAAVYLGSQRRAAGEVFPFLMTLVLLSILVAMTTLVIGDNVARAFGLVGALSIVRFRTVVDDTRDTSFVIFAVVVGMAIGAGYVSVCAVGVPIVAMVALSMNAVGRGLRPASPQALLEVRIGRGIDPDPLLTEVFRRYLTSYRLTAATTARQGIALDLHYAVKLTQPDAPLTLLNELMRLEGVQNVELKTP